ncbi:hypothetical protein JL721_5009 [Aureococcus anophagefferens]|nr:hypothetical protein JL721_5009 [Aureococcus anophagefferens]
MYKVKGKGALVREGKDLKSPEVQQLPTGVEVLVDAIESVNGKDRARLSEPIQGWVSLKCLEKVGSAAAPATVATPKPAAPAEPSSPKSPRSVNESPWSAGRDGGAVDGAAWDLLMDAGGDERAYANLKLAERSAELEAPEKVTKELRAKAAADADALVKLDPHSAEGYALRASVYVEDEDLLADAAADYGRAAMLSEGDDRDGFEASKAEAEAALKRRDARRATLKKAHEDLKAVADDAFRGGRFLEAVKKYGEALRVVEDDDDRAKLFSNRSAAHLKLKDYDEALRDADAIVKLSPKWPKGHARRGQAYRAMGGAGRAKKARLAFAEGLKLDPVEHAYWYYAMASSLDARDAGNQTAKLDCLKRLVKEDGLQARKRDALFKRDAKLKPSAVRVWACSDVHYDHHGAPEWADALSDTMYQRDSLLLAGDIADTLYGVELGAGNGRDIANFYLGRFPLVSADFWTSDHPSERSRSVDAFFRNARARDTQG